MATWDEQIPGQEDNNLIDISGSGITPDPVGSGPFRDMAKAGDGGFGGLDGSGKKQAQSSESSRERGSISTSSTLRGPSSSPTQSTEQSGSYTPKPSATPTPDGPISFEPMDPMASPAAIAVSRRAPFQGAPGAAEGDSPREVFGSRDNPSQYGGSGMGRGMLGRTGGLTGGGLGIPGAAGTASMDDEQQLDALIRLLTQQK